MSLGLHNIQSQAHIDLAEWQEGQRGAFHAPVIQDRFWSKVNKNGPVPADASLGPCWVWTASVQWDGYGQIGRQVNGKFRIIKAHRESWVRAYGPVPDGLSVLHRCDVPCCVNPSHLFLGTQPQNLADARSKGRLVDGLHARKLSDAAYEDILNSRETGIALARKYGVTKTTISRIRNGHQGSTFHRSQLNNVQRRTA